MSRSKHAVVGITLLAGCASEPTSEDAAISDPRETGRSSPDTVMQWRSVELLGDRALFVGTRHHLATRTSDLWGVSWADGDMRGVGLPSGSYSYNCLASSGDVVLLGVFTLDGTTPVSHVWQGVRPLANPLPQHSA